VTRDGVPALVESGAVIAVVTTYGHISLWNDDQKDSAIGWAGFMLGRGSHVAVVDPDTLDPEAVEEARQRQEVVARHSATLLDLLWEDHGREHN
jgi:hypothetical protein